MKKPIVLLIVLGVLVAFAAIYEKGYLNKITQGGGLVGVPRRELVLPDLDTTKIRNIRITEGDKHLNLALADGRWSVAERKGYPASFDKVERSVKYLAEMKVKNKTEVPPSVLGDVKLLAPGEASAERTGLKVELLDEKGAALATIIAGASTTTSGGASASSGNMFGGPGELRMVRVVNGSDKDTVWQVDDNLGDLSADPKDWVDKAFVDVRNVKSAEITAPVAADSWKAERKDMNSPFALVNPAPGEELDTAKADGLTSVLSSATFQDVLSKDQASEALMKDAFKTKLVTEEGFTYDISAIEKKEGAGSDVSSKIYVTLKVSADIPKERKAPADEKPEDKKKNDEAFAAENKARQEKLTKEKAFENWVFEVPSYNSGILVKKRSEILRDKTATPPKKEEPAAAITIPGVPSLRDMPKLPPPVQPPPPPSPPATTPPATTPTPVPGAKSTERPAPPATNPPAKEPKSSEKKPAASEAKPKAPESKPAAPEAKPSAPEAKPAPAPQAPKSEPAPKPAAEPKPAPDPETPPAPKPENEAKPPGESKPPGQ